MTPESECETPRGFLMQSVRVKDKTIKYVAYVPPTYDPDKPTPCIVFLNGMGECGTDGLKQILVGLGPAVILNVDKWPFIILFPQKQVTEADWEDEDDMVMAIIEKARHDLHLDESRMYLTGLSQGGHGTWSIGAKHPDMWAAIAPICGWGDEAMAKALVKMPIWVFHGDQDNAVDIERAREMAKYLESAGGSCKLTIYAGVGHNSWDKAYREEKLWEWFMQHRRG